jgi:hypothetical protein
MAICRILGSFVIVLAVAGLGRAQDHDLAENPKVGDCLKIHLAMTLSGEMRVTKDDKPLPLKMAAAAAHDFSERILAVNSATAFLKTARIYDTARATITTGNDKSERTLRSDRRILVAQQSRGQNLVYCPAGPLTHEELELTGEHFDTLAVTGLLPGKAVKIGDTWKVNNEAVQALCNFEGLTTQDLTCKLDDVKDNVARVSVTGSAGGIDLGALVKSTVQGSFQFDLAARRLTTLEWKQTDDRAQGPASPAAAVETTTSMTRNRIDQPDSLSDVALISVPDGQEPPAEMTLLSYHHQAKTPFDLTLSRDWQWVGQTSDHVIFRLMDRGDFVAQVTITPWESAAEGKHLSPDAFREAMAKTPGWEQGDVAQDGEVPADKGRWIYRIAAAGAMDGLKVIQNFYLIAGAGGEQVVLAFTMTASQAEKLGTRDLALVQALEFPGKK